MELWIPLTICAAFFQNIRSVLQKHLVGKLSKLGAAYIRFLYALPIALIYLILVSIYSEAGIPQLNARFLVYALLGGLCQIMFTVFLLWLFSFRNFAVGTTLSKLETVMVALFGLLLLGDELTAMLSLAILLSAIGLIIMSAGQTKLTPRSMLTGLWHMSTLIGLACAAWLGLSVVLFRAASLSLQLDEFVMAAAFTLCIVLVLQTLIMGVVMVLREPGQLEKIFLHWRPASLVGISGGFASICWFSAFTLQNAGYVRALGQIELLFTFIATLFFFHEKVSSSEVIGITLITGSLILLLI